MAGPHSHALFPHTYTPGVNIFKNGWDVQPVLALGYLIKLITNGWDVRIQPFLLHEYLI